MANQFPQVSIVCTVRDAADAVGPFHEALFKVVRGLEHLYRFEILYVDDGSRDATFQRLQALAEIDTRVRVLALTRPFGKENALIAGLEHASGSLVITLDGDLSHPPDLIPKMLEAARQQDVVVAVDSSPRSSKNTLGSGLLSWFCEGLPPGSASHFLVLSRRAVDTLLTIPERHRSLLGLVWWLDLPRVELPFTPNPDAPRRPHETPWQSGIETIFAHSRRPIQVIQCAGAGLLGVGLFLMVWFPLQSILRPDTVWFSWCYLIILLHLVGGSILFALGVVGGYVVRALEQVKQRPLYVLKYDSRACVPKVLPFAPGAQAA